MAGEQDGRYWLGPFPHPTISKPSRKRDWGQGVEKVGWEEKKVSEEHPPRPAFPAVQRAHGTCSTSPVFTGLGSLSYQSSPLSSRICANHFQSRYSARHGLASGTWGHPRFPPTPAHHLFRISSRVSCDKACSGAPNPLPTPNFSVISLLQSDLGLRLHWPCIPLSINLIATRLPQLIVRERRVRTFFFSFTYSRRTNNTRPLVSPSR